MPHISAKSLVVLFAFVVCIVSIYLVFNSSCSSEASAQGPILEDDRIPPLPRPEVPGLQNQGHNVKRAAAKVKKGAECGIGVRLAGKQCPAGSVPFGSECYVQACLEERRQMPSAFYYGAGGNAIGAYTPVGLAYNPLRIAPLTNWGRKRRSVEAEKEHEEVQLERVRRQMPSHFFYGSGGNAIGAYTPVGLAYNPLRIAPLTNWGR
ncbi:unnamed protein product, partial [Mesorhabditis spiculigera]